MSATLSSKSVIVLGGIASSDPPCCATSCVDSLSRGPVRSEPASADWLSSRFCDPVGCEPVSPEHPTRRTKVHPIMKAPTTAMRCVWRTTATHLLWPCVTCYYYLKACHTKKLGASPTQPHSPECVEALFSEVHPIR